MKLTYSKAISICGFLWFFIGYKIIMKGIVFFNELYAMQKFTENQLSFFIGCSLFLGFIKGKFILTKSADRTIRHIVSFEEPLKIRNIIPKTFLVVMVFMMSLGMLLKYSHIPYLYRGIIDFTVGSALIIGAMHFFKKAYMIKLSMKKI